MTKMNLIDITLLNSSNYNKYSKTFAQNICLYGMLKHF